jgi:hypothetical protein
MSPAPGTGRRGYDMQFVLTTVTCAALVPTDNVKSGVRRGGRGK